MSKDYQKTGEMSWTSRQERADLDPVVPDVVSVAMDQIAADVRKDLLAIVVGAGLQVMGDDGRRRAGSARAARAARSGSDRGAPW